MRLLAISTAFSNSDIAISFDEKEDYISYSSNAKHSENALVCVDNLLQKNNIDIADMQCMAVVVGPGSFTGIRIGIGLVKGMYVAKPTLKLISIVSLDLMANIYKQRAKSDFCCVIDGLSGNFFVCNYDKNGNRKSQPQMLTEIDQSTIVGLKNENLSFCTDFIEFTPQNLLAYAKQLYQNNVFTPESELLPLYLRKSQAEMNYDKKN